MWFKLHHEPRIWDLESWSRGSCGEEKIGFSITFSPCYRYKKSDKFREREREEVILTCRREEREMADVEMEVSGFFFGASDWRLTRLFERTTWKQREWRSLCLFLRDSKLVFAQLDWILLLRPSAFGFRLWALGPARLLSIIFCTTQKPSI